MNRRALRRADRPSRADAGSTLLEVLIASFLMGSAILVMVTGMSTLFASSIQNRESTTAGVVARNYAESLVIAVAQPGAWCSATYTVTYAPPADYPVSADFGACPADTPTTPQFQTATITVTAPTGLTERLRMVVRET